MPDELFTNTPDQSLEENWATVSSVSQRMRKDAPAFWALWRMGLKDPNCFRAEEWSVMKTLRRGYGGERTFEKFRQLHHVKRIAVMEEIKRCQK